MEVLLMLTINMLLLGSLFCAAGLGVLAGPVLSGKDDLYKEFLEKCTRSESSVTLKERLAANPKASPWENSGKYQGDILLDEEQVQSMLANTAVRRWDSKWPQNTVIYEFDSGSFNDQQRSAIEEAMEDISENTCISFRLRESIDTAYVIITNNQDGCYAIIGYNANLGAHTLNLADDCFVHTIIVHEWLHIIGFTHMHSTYNRDDYVKILWENITPGQEHNFDINTSDEVSKLNLPYDFSSIMHYGPFSMSANGNRTIVARVDDDGLMGQEEFVSSLDWLRVNRRYDCPGAWD